MFDFFKKKINLKNVLVCIGQKYNDDKYEIPYVEDLIIYFVIEDNAAYRILSKEEFDLLKISGEELLNIGINNVKNKIFSIYRDIPVHYNKDAEVIIPFDAEQLTERGIYNFWTSLVLIPEIWDKNSDLCINKEWKKFYVAMPYRTLLLIGNYDNIKSKEEILSQVEAYVNAAPEELADDIEASKRKISTKLYVIEDCKLKSDK